MRILVAPDRSLLAGSTGGEFHDGLLEISVDGGVYLDTTGKKVIQLPEASSGGCWGVGCFAEETLLTATSSRSIGTKRNFHKGFLMTHAPAIDLNICQESIHRQSAEFNNNQETEKK